ncbi:hypothetical protein Pan44_32300 [Caulifigura coniformis]|uniref:DUF1598 domain-containing protein n=1 Tax=Caulifigura coniformis TaxID=2527983 RepID=A0A517SGD9_9PLAN|nr:permease prefix domain 1-containing protein [Caulifigura coniformis]QDT55188.1 hypothetical protein Pan44_32300 [Caulifigura coniformis]
MAEHEFERFLGVLSRLLKLSSKETAAVADEICDHLEERYSELIGRGVSRDDAVKRALDEFDDAGEFAAKLNQLVRQRTRRRIMTGALTTAAASALAILITTAFWPDQRLAGNGVAQTAAVQQSQPPATPDDIVYIDEGQFLPDWLRKRVEDDLKPQSITELKRFLQEFTGRIVGVDYTELKSLGLDPKVEISPTPAGAPLYVVLDRALQNVGGEDLDWLIDPDDGMLKITGREKVATIKFPLTVDVSPLLSRGLDMDGVIDLLQSQTTGPWHAVDGEGGVMTPLGSRITIMASRRIHLECQAVLAALAAKGKMVALSEPFSTKSIGEALKKEVSCDFQKTPLREALVDFTRQTGQHFVFDHRALQDAGIGLDGPVTLSIRKAPLGTALKLLWLAVAEEQGVEPKVVSKDGLLSVTSDEAEPMQQVYVLDVSDLVSQDDLPQLISLIFHATPGPWHDIDGDGGTIKEIPDARIIVRQDRRNLDQLVKLLDDHRAVAKQAVPVPAHDPNAIEVRYYRMTESQAQTLMSIIPKYVAANSWSVQFEDGSLPSMDTIAIPGVQGGGFFQVGGVPGEPQVVLGPKVMLVIRQTRKVHREIEKFLKDLSRKSGASFFDPVDGVNGGAGSLDGSGGGGLN